MSWAEVFKIKKNTNKRLDSTDALIVEVNDNIYIQTLVQNLSDESVDWVFRTAPNLGRIMNAAYRLNNPAFETALTWGEIKNNEAFVYALISSDLALAQIIGNTFMGSEFLNIIVKNDTNRKYFDTRSISRFYSAITKALSNTTYFTASTQTTQYVSSGTNYNNSGTWTTTALSSGKCIALVLSTSGIGGSASGTVYSLDGSLSFSQTGTTGMERNAVLSGGIRVVMSSSGMEITSRVYTAK